MLIAVASAPFAGTDNSIVLEGTRGGQPVSIVIHFGAIAELRTAVSGGREVASGLIGGALSEDRIIVEHCSSNGASIGLFRTQPAGWPTVTEPDLKRIQVAMPRATSAILMVVRTLAQRPWSAAVFIVDPKRASTTEPALIEFPFDEYLLRKGWLTDLTPPPAPPPSQRPAGGWSKGWILAALASVAVVGGGAAAYETHRSRPAAIADVPELTPVVAPRIGLHASRSVDEFELSWNRASEVVRTATGGTLIIHNGSVVRMAPISAAQLREGRVMYHPVPGVDIDFRLELAMPDRRVEAESISVLGFDTAPTLTLPVAAPRPKPAPAAAPADRIDVAKAVPKPSQSQTEPQPIRRADPMVTREVTEEMRNAKGEVSISVLVSIDGTGKVDSAKIVGANGEPTPSNHIRLAALNAAQQWRFRPATSGGRAVPSTLTLAFRF